jgi:hypothetical protein
MRYGGVNTCYGPAHIQNLSDVKLLWFTHTEIKLLDQPVDSDIVYQSLFDLIFRIHQKLNKRRSVRINVTMRLVRVTTVAAETYSERVSVAVVSQRVTPMLRSIWSPTT